MSALRHTWLILKADQVKDGRAPTVPDEKTIDAIVASKTLDVKKIDAYKKQTEKIMEGFVFIENNYRPSRTQLVYNLHLSKCYGCKMIAIWVHKKLVFPPKRYGVRPNPDLPKDVLGDYEEARSIIDKSPRGAAALLRLSIQKLCAHLKESGKDLNTDIAALVTKGLSMDIQKALDIVRVVGNNAVHPGQIDIKDDRKTAETLFKLVNLICEKTITEPKQIQKVYESLPETARRQIEKRDKAGGNLSKPASTKSA